MPPATTLRPSSTNVPIRPWTMLSSNYAASTSPSTSTVSSVRGQLVTEMTSEWIASSTSQDMDTSTLPGIPTMPTESNHTETSPFPLWIPFVGGAGILVLVLLLVIILLKVRRSRRKRAFQSKGQGSKREDRHSSGGVAKGGVVQTKNTPLYATVDDPPASNSVPTPQGVTLSPCAARLSSIPSDSSIMDRGCRVSVVLQSGETAISSIPFGAVLQGDDTDDMVANPKYERPVKSKAAAIAALAPPALDRQDSMRANPLYGGRRKSAPFVQVGPVEEDCQQDPHLLGASLPNHTRLDRDTIASSPGYGNWDDLHGGGHAPQADDEEEDCGGSRYESIWSATEKQRGSKSENPYTSLYDSLLNRVDHSGPLHTPPSSVDDLFRVLKSHAFHQLKHSDVILGQELYRGGFSVVHRGELRVGDQQVPVVVKTTAQASSKDSGGLRALLQEAVVMGQLHHPNIVRQCGVVTHGDKFLLVLELMAKCSLRSLLITMREKSGEQADTSVPGKLLKCSQDIASSMAYLESRKLVHRDLAAQNILVDTYCVCKVADFSMSRILADSPCYKSDVDRVPFRHAAPEVLLDHRYSSASDVWSYGMVLFEVYSFGQEPYENMSEDEVVKFVSVDQHRLPAPPNCSRNIYQIMTDCWRSNPDQRPSFPEIVQQLNNSISDILSSSGADHAHRLSMP